MMPKHLLAPAPINYATSFTSSSNTANPQTLDASPDSIFNAASAALITAHRSLSDANLNTLQTGCFTTHERSYPELSSLHAGTSEASTHGDEATDTRHRTEVKRLAKEMVRSTTVATAVTGVSAPVFVGNLAHART